MYFNLLLLIVMEVALKATFVYTMPGGSAGLLIRSTAEEAKQRDSPNGVADQKSSSPKPNLEEAVEYHQKRPKHISPQIIPTFEIDLEIPFSEKTNPDVEKSAIKCMAKYLGVKEQEVKISSYHTSNGNGGAHYYFYQELPYLDRYLRIVNADANMNVVEGIVRSVGNTFYGKDKTRDVNIKPSTRAGDAILAFAKILEIPLNAADEKILQESQENVFDGLSFTETKISAALTYMQDLAVVSLVWDFEVDMDTNVYTVRVCAISSLVVSLEDQVEDATYTAYRMDRIVDPDIDGRVQFVDPMYKPASPQGWHQSNLSFYSDTCGNNVLAQENHDGNGQSLIGKRTQGKAGLNFNAPFDPTTGDPTLFYEGSITNLFVVTNWLHDIFYTVGFDEPAGNFQEYNFDRNFKDGEKDPLIADAQYGAKVGRMNNCSFRTPVDGVSPRMKMRLFNERVDGRLRDSSVDNSIIIHEYLHGISRRLTGGRMNVLSLNHGESWGLSEGWSDIFAVVLRTTKDSNRSPTFRIGSYVHEGGFRHNPYCADLGLNPSTYGDVLDAANQFKEKHDMGEIWTSILLEVYWDLRDQYGLAVIGNTDDMDWYKASPGLDGRHSKDIKGNQLFVHLVIHGMKLQPSNPTFIQARDAILEADKTIYEGIHLDILWKAFARRGLGWDAQYPGVAGYQLPNISPQKVWYIKPKVTPVIALGIQDVSVKT